MKKSLGLAWCLLWTIGSAGCSSSDGSHASQCAVQTQAFDAQCNDCVNASCCPELTACAPGTECHTCAIGGVCTSTATNQLNAVGVCVADHCASACPDAVGTGGTGAAGAGTGGSSGTGATSGTGGTAGTGGTSCNAPCGTTCCDSGAVCFDDGAGNLRCATACSANSQCPASTPVCTLLQNGKSACTLDVGGLQRCATGADCASAACAPNVDSSGNPVGPRVCVANDGSAYHGCNGLTICGTGTCCFGDANGNLFCATQCANDSQCGAAHCQTYDNSHTSCAGTMGCGPF